MRIVCLFFLCAMIARLATGAESLFADPVVVKSKLFQIRESDVQEAYVAQKAAAAALGQPQPPQLEARLKQQIIDRMIATRLLLARATPLDQDAGRRLAQRLLHEGRERAGSEAAYRRRLLAVGSSPEKHEAELLEQAIVQQVIDRELRARAVVSDMDIRKFYEENTAAYTEPEKARVLHLLFATRKIPSGEPLPLEQRQAKRASAERALAQAKAGEDFASLVRELSEDPDSPQTKGELTFSRGSGTVPPQFEAAAFSLEPGAISDVVSSVFGFHIIKLVEKIPESRVPIERVQDRIRELLERQEVQRRLPDFIDQLRKEAEVEVLGSR